MSSVDTGGPAFPSSRDMRHNPDFDHEEGMTLRDYFAAKAMQSLMAMEHASECVDDNGDPMGEEEGDVGTLFIHTEFLAIEAYGIADAMLKARSRGR